MIKRVILVLILVFSTYSLASSKMDENLMVEKVFKKMERAYKDENKKAFFHYVSESKFQQDYLSFYDSVDEDFNINDILSTNTWIDKIASDGKKRFLYVKWIKRYQDISSNQELELEGSTEFLFDQIKGKYKLIDFSGDQFWGVSKP